jgi:hypothetical protein
VASGTNIIIGIKVMIAGEIKYKLGGTCGTHGRTENYIYCFVENYGRKKLLGRPKRRWGGIIDVLKEMRFGCMD